MIISWVGHWVSALLNFDTKNDFWHLKPFRNLIGVIERQKYKTSKRQEAKRQNDKKSKRQKDKRTRGQKDKLILWCQGSFVLLRCFFLPPDFIGLFCSAPKWRKSLHPKAVIANWSNQRNLFSCSILADTHKKCTFNHYVNSLIKLDLKTKMYNLIFLL